MIESLWVKAGTIIDVAVLMPRGDFVSATISRKQGENVRVMMVAKHRDGGGIVYRQVVTQIAMDTCFVVQQKKVKDNERMEATEKALVVAAPANGRNERKKIWQKVKF